jgi:hypothetical protein
MGQGELLPVPEETARRRVARICAEIEAPFIRNEHGLWCPQCGELIAEWEWIGDCDACGYPSEIEDDYDDDR